MTTRPPSTPQEHIAMIKAENFVSDLRKVFEQHNMEMRALIARTPDGFILTLGDATDYARAVGVEAIEMGETD
jgi:hypothetical protein